MTSDDSGHADALVADADLIAAHAAGDPHAFGELIGRHRDRMWAVALRTLGDPEDAAEALHDAFTSAFHAAGSLRAEGQVTTWLHRIVVNACLDRVRRGLTQLTVPLPETDPVDPPQTEIRTLARKPDRTEITALLEQSSLGTDAARSLRSRATPIGVDRILQRAQELAPTRDPLPTPVRDLGAPGSIGAHELRRRTTSDDVDEVVARVAAHARQPGWELRLLGPLEVRCNGVAVVPTTQKSRAVLAMLALHADHVVPVGSLLTELWGENAPRSAFPALHTYILRLRRLIRGALDQSPIDTRQVLATHPGGYLLDTMGGSVDVREFDRLASLGDQARELGDLETASRHYSDALGIWRGPALADVQVGPRLVEEALRLEDARLTVLDHRIDTDLRLGRHRELVGELTGLVARHPIDEGLHAHLMLALYRSGRRDQAIDVFRRLRATLISELGLEPSPRLRQLGDDIVRSDPRLSTVMREVPARHLD